MTRDSRGAVSVDVGPVTALGAPASGPTAMTSTDHPTPADPHRQGSNDV